MVSAVDGADMVIFSAAYMALEEDLGFSPKILGLLDSVCAVVAAITCVLWASYVSTHCPKMLLVYSAIGWGVITLGLGLTSQLWVWLLLRALHGIALAGFAPIIQTLIARSVSEKERGSYFGKVYCWNNFGALVGLNISASVSRRKMMIFGMGFHAWRSIFILVGFISLTLAFVVSKWFTALPAARSSAAAVESIRRTADSSSTLGQFKTRMGMELRQFLHYCWTLPTFVIIVFQVRVVCFSFSRTMS